MMSLQISSPPISISHQLFRCRYSNSRDVHKCSCNLSFLFLPHHQSAQESWLAGYPKRKDLTVTYCETVSYNLFERFQLHVQLYMVQLGRLFLLQLKLHMQSSFQNTKILYCIGQTSNVPVTCKSLLV